MKLNNKFINDIVNQDLSSLFPSQILLKKLPAFEILKAYGQYPRKIALRFLQNNKNHVLK